MSITTRHFDEFGIAGRTAEALWAILFSESCAAEPRAEAFNGYSIGPSGLTQRIPGLDRDSGTADRLFDENDDAQKRMIEDAIGAAQRAGKRIGIRGQTPSNFPDFGESLVELEIDSILLNPGAAIRTALPAARTESKVDAGRNCPSPSATRTHFGSSS